MTNEEKLRETFPNTIFIFRKNGNDETVAIMCSDEWLQGDYDQMYKDSASREDCVSKAIETIVNYCSERACGNCHLFSPEGCIFICGYPHEWLEVQEELKARRLEEEAANK